MALVRGANLALAFLLELGALLAVGSYGFGLEASLPVRVAVGIGAIAAYAAAWGLVAAPKAPCRLGGAARAGFEVLFFGSAALLAAARGHRTYAVVLAGLVLVNRVTLRLWHQQDDVASPRGAAA